MGHHGAGFGVVAGRRCVFDAARALHSRPGEFSGCAPGLHRPVSPGCAVVCPPRCAGGHTRRGHCHVRFFVGRRPARRLARTGGGLCAGDCPDGGAGPGARTGPGHQRGAHGGRGRMPFHGERLASGHPPLCAGLAHVAVLGAPPTTPRRCSSSGAGCAASRRNRPMHAWGWMRRRPQGQLPRLSKLTRQRRQARAEPLRVRRYRPGPGAKLHRPPPGTR